MIPKRWLRKIFARRKLKNKNKILVLIDFENLVRGIKDEFSPETGFSVGKGLNRIIKKIAREVGEIINVLVFVPPHFATDFWTKILDKEGFYTLICPKVPNKEGGMADNVDSKLMDFGRSMIANINGLTGLCICSGDRDYRPLIHDAILKGLEIIVIAGSLKSLSTQLVDLADRTFVFSPTEEN